MPTGKRVKRRIALPAAAADSDDTSGAAAGTTAHRYAVRYAAPIRCTDDVVRTLSPAIADQLPTLLTAAQLAELEQGGLITRLE